MSSRARVGRTEGSDAAALAGGYPVSAEAQNEVQMLTDAERDRATRLLRERYANGALTLPELDAQLQAVLTADSKADLHAVLSDDDVAQIPMRMLGRDVVASDVERLEEQLAPGEAIYWIGHPATRIRLSPRDIVWVPVSAGWTLISGLGLIAVNWPLTLPLLGLFVASLQMLFGRFIFANRRRRRTIYAVSDRRVIIILRRRWLPNAIRSIYLTAIPRIATHAHRSGVGSVLLGDAPREEPFTWLTKPDETTTAVGLYDLSDAQTVADLIETVRERYAHLPSINAATAPSDASSGDI